MWFAGTEIIYFSNKRSTHTQAHMYDVQHTRGISTTRHRSLDGRGLKMALFTDKGPAHTKKKIKKTDIANEIFF